MSQLRELQQSFMKHLLDSPSNIIEHIQSTPDTNAQQRLNIYASGYRLRLKEAITSDFDCLHGYLGDEMFEQLMNTYIDKYQSQHPSLRYYSKHITELLTDKKPFSDFPELVELAKIEQAFNDSFDAENCKTINMEQLGKTAVEAWPNMQVKFHASLQLLKCKHNIFAIWKALSDEDIPPALEKDNTAWIIWRKDLISRYRALDDAETYALTRAMQGDNFGQLCEGLLAYFDEEQTPVQAVTYLQTWINDMMICDI